MPDRHQNVLQTVPVAPVVVNIPGRDIGHAFGIGEGNEPVDASGIAGDEVVLEFHENVVRAEPLHELAELPARFREAAIFDQASERSAPAPGEQNQTGGVIAQDQRIEPGGVFGIPVVSGRVVVILLVIPAFRFVIRQPGGGVGAHRTMCGREEFAEILIPELRFGEEGDVAAIDQRDLGAGDRLNAGIGREPGEFERTVHPVVIGDRQRLIAELLRTQHQLIRPGCAVQEGIVAMKMKFDVRVHRR